MKRTAGVIVGVFLVLFAVARNFAAFYVQWFSFFVILTNLIELVQGIDLKQVYIILMMLFLIAFLIMHLSRKEE